MKGEKVPRVKPGSRYGRLLVLERFPSGEPEPYWKCRCDCGVEVAVRDWNLRAGRTRSCGCLRSEVKRAAMTKYWAERKAKEAMP